MSVVQITMTFYFIHERKTEDQFERDGMDAKTDMTATMKPSSKR